MNFPYLTIGNDESVSESAQLLKSTKLEAIESSQNTIGSSQYQLSPESAENDKSAPKFPQINGRLLLPNEGCGYSPVRTTRIVGGSVAHNGTVGYEILKHFSKI